MEQSFSNFVDCDKLNEENEKEYENFLNNEVSFEADYIMKQTELFKDIYEKWHTEKDFLKKVAMFRTVCNSHMNLLNLIQDFLKRNINDLIDEAKDLFKRQIEILKVMSEREDEFYKELKEYYGEGEY